MSLVYPGGDARPGDATTPTEMNGNGAHAVHATHERMNGQTRAAAMRAGADCPGDLRGPQGSSVLVQGLGGNGIILGLGSRPTH